jgi:opine dehydrogenase
MAGTTIAIIGAGNGGCAIAGDMALAGHDCRLFEFPEYAGNIAPIQSTGGIEVTGIARTGFAKLALATTDLAAAVAGTEVVMVATQALSHERTGRESAPLLQPGQAVVLWPGSGGTLVVRKVWDELGLTCLRA